MSENIDERIKEAVAKETKRMKVIQEEWKAMLMGDIERLREERDAYKMMWERNGTILDEFEEEKEWRYILAKIKTK
jgi:hypothetical protein